MQETMCSVYVPAGETVEDTMYFDRSILEWAGITAISHIVVSFSISNSDTSQYLESTPWVEIKTSIADTYVQTHKDEGQVLYEKDGLKILYQGVIDSQKNGPSGVLYIENMTEERIVVHHSTAIVNGKSVQGVLYADMHPGSRKVATIHFIEHPAGQYEVEEAADIESMELSFRYVLYDNEETFYTDPVSIDVQ